MSLSLTALAGGGANTARDLEEVQARRRFSLAEQLSKLANDATPIRAHSQGLARMAQGALAGYLMGREERLARERQDKGDAEFSQISGNLTRMLMGQPPVDAASAQPQPDVPPAPQGGFGGSTLGTGPSEPPAGMYGRNAPLVPQRDATLSGTPEQLAGASASRAAATNPLLQPGTQFRANPGTDGAFAGLPAPSGQVPPIRAEAGNPLLGPLPDAAPQQVPAAQTPQARPGLDLNAFAGTLAPLYGHRDPRVRALAQGFAATLPALREQQERGERRTFQLEDRAAAEARDDRQTAEARTFQERQAAEARAFQERQAAALRAWQEEQTRQRQGWETQQQERTLARPPSGYEPNPGGAGLRPIPGGPADPTAPGAGGTASEGERKASGFLQRMEASERFLTDLTKPRDQGGAGYNPGNTRDRVAGSIPFVGNWLTTDEGQRYLGHAAEWARAKLRHESGAVISDQEAADEARTYFPMPGDSAATIADKARRRAVAMEAMRTAAGRLGRPQQGGSSGGEPAAPDASGRPPLSSFGAR